MNLKLAEEYYKSNDYLQKLQARANYLSLVEKEPLLRNRYIIEDWAVNPVSFIETFGWVKLTEMNGKIAPLFLWEYQKNIIFKLQEAEQDATREHEILIDKPREMGVTWVMVWYMLWRWLFRSQWSGFVLSRTESEVDGGNDDPDSSIFGKFRWAQKKLPVWILPKGFVPKAGQRGTSTDMNLRIMNPGIESSLIGSTTNSNAGRSRRYSFSFIDECFAIEGFNNVYRSLQTVSRVKVFASTVRVGTIFKKFRDLCEEKGDYISLKWQDHPWKDQEWFDDMTRKAEVDPEVMKEISVDYNINLRQQYYPEIAKSEVRDFDYNPSLPTYVSMDFGSQDKTVLIWYQFDGREIKVLECFSSSRRALDWYIPFLNPHVEGFTIDDTGYTDYQKTLMKRLANWKKPVAYFGEAAHFQKNMPSNRSIADELVKYQIRLLYNPHAIKHEARRNATSLLLPRCVFNTNSTGVTELYDALAASRYNSSMKSVTSKEALMKPVHDPEIADFRASFENMTVNVPRIMRNQRADLPRTANGRVDPMMSGIAKYLKI